MGAARVPQPLTQVFATRTFLAGPTDGSVRQTSGKTWAKKDSSRHLRKKVPDSQEACAKVPNVSSHRENANSAEWAELEERRVVRVGSWARTLRADGTLSRECV